VANRRVHLEDVNPTVGFEHVDGSMPDTSYLAGPAGEKFNLVRWARSMPRPTGSTRCFIGVLTPTGRNRGFVSPPADTLGVWMTSVVRI
jgi:hypothetical protein